MINLECETGSDGVEGAVVKVSGEMILFHAKEVQAALLQAIDANPQVQIDLAQVTRIDLTAMQLLCAAHRHAGCTKRLFTCALPTAGSVREAMAVAGYTRHVGCSHDEQGNCIWRSCRE
jgi:anti-anti-sigma regulatory factor